MVVLMPLSTIFQLYRDGQFFFVFFLVQETGVPTENHWQILSYNVESSTARHEWDTNSQL